MYRLVSIDSLIAEIEIRLWEAKAQADAHEKIGLFIYFSLLIFRKNSIKTLMTREVLQKDVFRKNTKVKDVSFFKK